MYSFYVYKINCENEQSILLYNYSLITFYQYMFKLIKSCMVIIIVYYEQLKVHIYYLHVLSFLFFMVVARDFFLILDLDLIPHCSSLVIGRKCTLI